MTQEEPTMLKLEDAEVLAWTPSGTAEDVPAIVHHQRLLAAAKNLAAS
jgi:hypothetical protein